MKSFQTLTKRGLCLLATLALSLGTWVHAQDAYFTKVAAASDLTNGDTVIIVAEDGTDFKVFNGTITTQKWGSFTLATAVNNGIKLTDPRVFVVEKHTDDTLYLCDKTNSQYLQGTSSGNEIAYTADKVKVTLTDLGIHDVTANANLRLGGANGFRFYRNNGNTGKASVLYKKSEAPADACEEVSNAQAVPTRTTVTLSWTAPATAPAQGYKVTLNGKDTITTQTTLTLGGLNALTKYTYKIVSVCSEDNQSAAVSGEFVTLYDPAMQAFVKVTEAAQIEENATYLFVNETEAQKTALAKYNSNLYQTAPIFVVNDTIRTFLATTSTEQLPHEISIKKDGTKDDTTYIHIADPVEGRYFALNTDGNYIHLNEATGNTTKWRLVFATNGTVNIHSDTLPARRIRYNYNNGNDRFSTYTSAQKDVVLYKRLAAINPTPVLRAPVSQSMPWTTENTAVTKTIRVSGSYLTADVTVTCPQGNFSVDKTSLTKEDMMQAVGTSFVVTYNGRLQKDTAKIALKSGTLSDTITVYAVSRPAPCAKVFNVNVLTQPDTAILSWDTVNAPAVGYQIEIFKKSDSTLMARDTVKNPNTLTHKVGGLGQRISYFYYLTTLCGSYSVSDSVVGEFKTRAATDPALTITCPTNEQVFTSKDVTFTYTPINFRLGTTATDSGFLKYTITSNLLAEALIDTITDASFTKTFAKSGNYSVVFELLSKKDTGVLEFEVKETRNFSVNLPDVEAPVFTPETGLFTKDTAVTISCPTEGATLYYALNNAAFAPYTQAIALSGIGTYTIKAFAVKEFMDTSAVVTKIYTINVPAEIKGDMVFEELFDKVPNSTSDITNTINNYTTLPGWTAEKAYAQTGGGVLKLGTGSAIGSIQTPDIDLRHDNGKFVVSFYAQAWGGDATSIWAICGNDTIEVIGLDNTQSGLGSAAPTNMRHFAIAFTNGTQATKIKFQATKANNNRFLLDSIRIYQVLPEVPSFIGLSRSVTIATMQDVAKTQEITIKGRLLESDVTVVCPEGNFSVNKTTLPKDEVLTAAGCKFSITFNGTKALDSVKIALNSGVLSDTIKVKATAERIFEVADLEALINGKKDSLYRVSGKVVLTAQDRNRNTKWMQDDKAGILIDDASALVTTTYNVGDGITGLMGRLTEYNGQKQLVMVGNLPAASSTNNAINPIELTIDELNADKAKYCARVVKIKGLTLTAAEGNWQGNVDNYATNEANDSINIRTFVRNGNFVGEAKPQAKFDLVALVGLYNGKVQVSPRTKEDIALVVTNEKGVALQAALYPNPTGGLLFVETAEAVRMDIFNLSGVLVRSAKLAAGKTELNLHQSGIYFIRLSNAKGSLVHRVVVR